MDISKMTSAEEEMTETTAPSTKDEEELVEKEDNSIEKDGEEEEGLFEKDMQEGGEEEESATETHREESLEKQEEGGEDVEEVEQEANKKGEQRLSEKKAEAHTVVSGSGETKTAPSKKEKSKKGEAAMNVNNEVVKMRTEVKRVRALLIRKLLRHLADLKKKKGSEADLERNRRRAERLVEEISQMKRLRPDQVTKTALTSDFNFEKVCKDPTATMSQRALARIATHPQFSKKIDVVKAAVKAFEEERKKEKQKQKMTPFQEEEERDALKRKEEEETEDEEKEMEDEEEAEDDDENATTETAAPEEETTESSDQIKSEILARSKTVAISKSVKAQGKPTATQAPEKKPNLKPAPKLQQSNEDEEEDDEDDDEEEEEEDDDDDDDDEEEEKEEEDSVKEKHSNDDDKDDEEEEKESDLESSDEEEKEYFDDSTEERFRKQSEESESEDDFFVGKVSKFKKKKKKAHAAPNLKSQTSDEGQTDKPQPELNCKAPKLASVFCSTLSSSQPGRGGLSRDRGRGRGGDRSRGRGRGAHRGGGPDRGRGGHRGGGLDRGRGGHRGGGPDRFSKSPSKFQKQDGGARGKPGFKNSERGSEARQLQSEDKDRPSSGRGTERGRGGVARQQDHRRPGGFSHQAPQQALHPSWEASKKRKEQQGQIMAFQGKKIKFDDDD